MATFRPTGLVVGLGLLAGCEQPAQPRQQHRELRRMNTEGVYIVPRVTDGSPVRFGHASIEVVGPNNSTLGSRSSWEPTLPAEGFVRHLVGRAAGTGPTDSPERLTKLVFRCRYFDEDGAATGSDDVDSRFPKDAPEYRGRIQFTSLGIQGRVARIDVEVVKVGYVADGTERELDIGPTN
ncbi:MAG TPA: hypothetical protein VM597_25580 [Gemmataceae bacterium]|jgi:hypothetical protein|nr:hypothetical protein [Gemmataceae bacterium]